MKLDPRIERENLIYTPYSLVDNRTTVKLHDRGYFTNDISNFGDLDLCSYGELVEVSPDGDSPYARLRKSSSLVEWCQFYLPEGSLKPVEKKYRPFTDTKEFFIKTNFEVGDLIYIRSKPNDYEYHLLLIGWTDEGLMLGNFSEMTFDELLDKFELWDGEDKFIPFGVEDAE